MHLFVAIALLVQETPETAFKKVEATIERAKSVRVLFTLMPADEPDSLSRGTMTLDGETKMKMSADLRNKSSTRIALWTDFDAGRIRSSVADHQVEVKGDGRQVRQNFNVYLSRLGIFAGAMFEHGFWTGSSRAAGGVSVDLKTMFGLTNFSTLGPGRNGSVGLRYSFTAAFKPMPFLWAKIWYDPSTYRLMRREEAWSYEGKEEILVEEYELQLDEEKGGAPAASRPLTPSTPKSDAEQEVLFIQARLQVANEHLRKGDKQKAIDVLEDLALSFPKHPLLPEIKRLLEETKKK